LKLNNKTGLDNSIIRNDSKLQLARIDINLDFDSEINRYGLFRDKTQFHSANDIAKNRFQKKIKNLVSNGESLSIAILYPTTRIANNFSFIPEEQNSKNDYQKAFEKSLNLSIDFTDFFNSFKIKEDLENEKRLNEDIHFRIRELKALRNAYHIFFPSFKKLRIKRSGNPRLIFENDDSVLSFNQLSDGEQGVIALIGDIVRRLSLVNPKLDDPLLGEAIIMIDEIELHLHPTWQRKIIKKLEAIFPNCQFIITTHSPQVLSELNAENDKIIAIKDFKAFEIPTVFGRESNWILETVMETPARPSEFKNQLRKYFDLIDKNKLEEAETLRKKLEAQTGSDEPEFVKADMLIKRKKVVAE